MKIPTEIKDQIKNAYYYLECANTFPPPTKNAVHILLLLIAWENIIIAEEELHKWIDKKDINPKLYKDHAYKFKNAGSVDHIVLGSEKSKARTIEYSSPKELAKLREYCQYGFGSNARNVAVEFGSTWHSDSFEKKLFNKIQWTDALISAIEALEE